MFSECPNCRVPVSFGGAVQLTLLGSARCRACGSILGVSRPRRRTAWAIWIVAVLVALGVFRLQRYGAAVGLAVPLLLLPAIILLCERIVVLERRAFRCRKCGYDLQRLVVNRCPECGTTFDPAERERIAVWLATPRPVVRRLWIVVLALFLLWVATETAAVFRLGATAKVPTGVAARPAPAMRTVSAAPATSTATSAPASPGGG